VAEFCQGLNLPLVLSLGSSVVTGYFWLVKMNQERAGVGLFRVADFRPDRLQCSDVPGMEKATWYGEVFLANRSTLPAAVIRFQVELLWNGRWLPGKLVLEKKDDVPWTVEPLRVLARSFGCAFAVDQGTTREQLARPHRLRFTYLTLDGRRRRQEVVTCQPAAALRAA
jgi:hypothetical protein